MSPRTKEQFGEIRQRSRQRIMDAALELFGTYGYHSTSISKIAREAGISKGLMYNYFDSKEDLLHTILLEEMDEGYGLWKEVMKLDIPPLKKLRRATQKTVETVRHNLHHWQLLTSLAFQPDVLKGLEEEMGEFKTQAIGDTIELFIQIGVEDPLKETFFYGAFIDGMFLHYMNMVEDYPLDDMLEYFFQRYER